MAESKKVVLGYWAGPGRAQVHRFLLELTGVPYEETHYTDPKKWFEEDKKNLGIPFPNLPYLIDGEVKITESVNIAGYIVEKSGKHELHGKGNDKFIVRNLVLLINDLISLIYQSTQLKGAEKEKKLQDIKPKVKYVSDFLANKDWLLGYLTQADIWAFTVLGWFSKINADAFKEVAGKLPELFKRVENLEQIKAYLSSGRSPKFPQIHLGYWNSQGRAQVARYLLELTSQPYEETRYTGDGAKWFKEDKQSLGIPLPNLPFLIDGQVKISETINITNYITEKSGCEDLNGKAADKWLVQNLILALSDFASNVYQLSQLKDEEQKKKKAEEIAGKVKYFAGVQGQKDWLLGYFTQADVYAYTFIGSFSKLAPEAFKQVEGNLPHLFKKFEEFPKIQAYLHSDRFIK